MALSQRPYGETRRFSDVVGKYGYDTVGHHSLSIEALRERVTNEVNQISGNSVLAIAFAGFPGVGKTSQLRHLESALKKAIGKGSSPWFSYIHPVTQERTPIGRVGQNGDYGVLYGDYMFRAIGPDRRGVMLSDLESFLHHWGDDDKLARIYWDIVKGRTHQDRVYRGTTLEKEQRSALGEIELSTQSGNDKKIIVVEGVQSISSLTAIERRREKYKLRTLKILFDVSLVDSLVRLLRREHDQKKHPDGRPYSFREILEHRLIEQYFILKGFIGPAYQDPSVVLLDKPREMPPFRGYERNEILSFLDQYRLGGGHSTDSELTRFVYGLVARLQDYFTSQSGVTEYEYRLWKDERDKKKKAQLETTS